MAWTGKKASVIFTKPAEPSFLKKFKERVGYKEDSGINDKFQHMPAASEDDLEDKDDELPQVVQLMPGDLSKEEFEKLVTNDDEPESKEVEPTGLTSDGRIMFRKPTKEKRKTDEKSELSNTTKKKKSNKDEKMKNETDLVTVNEDKNKSIKKHKNSNKKLLSFDDEFDEDS